MPDPETLRDSTQIQLSMDAFEEVRSTVTEEFTVTVVENAGVARLIASPVEIRRINQFLARNGISVG